MPKVKTKSGKIIHLPYTKAGRKKAKMMKNKIDKKGMSY